MPRTPEADPQNSPPMEGWQPQADGVVFLGNKFVPFVSLCEEYALLEGERPREPSVALRLTGTFALHITTGLMVETDDYPSPRVIALWRRIIIRLYNACQLDVVT